MKVWDTIRIAFFNILIYVIDLGVIWLLFWLIDKLLLIESLDFIDLGSMLLNKLGRSSGYFVQFIVNVIDSLWLYAIAVFCVMQMGSSKRWKIIDNAILGFLLILIYDPRIAMALPSFLAAPLVFLQTKCHFSFGEHPNAVDIFYSDFGINPFYYTSFDIVVAIIFFISVAITVHKTKE